MGDARYSAAGQQSNAFTRFERFVRFLCNGAQFAAVQFDGDFKTVLAGGPFLEDAACNAACDGTQYRTDGRAATASDVRAGNATDRSARDGPDRRARTLDGDGSHAFNNTEPDGLFLACLARVINISGTGAGAAGNSKRTGKGCATQG